MKYVIDNARIDGYYKYSLLDDSGNVIKSGWGLLIQQPEDQRKAWFDAVKKYNKTQKINSVNTSLHDKINNIRKKATSNDDKFPEKKEPLAEINNIFSVVSNSENCDDSFLSKIKSAGTDPIPTPQSILRDAAKAEIFNLKLEIDKNINSIVSSGVEGYLMPVLDMCDELIDIFFVDTDVYYNEIKRAYAKYVKMYHDIEKSFTKEISDEVNDMIEQFTNIIDDIDGNVKEYLFNIFTFDVFNELITVIQNLWSSKEEVWESIINKLKCLVQTGEKLVEHGATGIKNIIKKIDPLIIITGALFGAFIGLICTNQKAEDIDTEQMARNIGVNPTGTDAASIRRETSNYIKQLQEDENKELSEISVVYRYASKNEHNFSLNKKTLETK